MSKKTLTQIKEELHNISQGTLSLVDENNVNLRSLTYFKHTCGNEFKARLDNILSGKANICPFCCESSRRKSKDAILEELSGKGCTLINSDNLEQIYVNHKYDMMLYCGCVVNRSIYTVIKSSQEKVNCTLHLNKYKLTVEEIQEKLNSLKYGSFTLLSKSWQGWKGPLKYSCNNCSSVFEESMAILHNREGKCKNCFGSVNSIKEVYCNILLTELGVKFQAQYYIDKYPFDFYLPDFNTLIEIDGKQHITSTFKGVPFKSNDEIKNNLAKDLGLNLIRISVKDNLTKTILNFVQRPSKA